MLMSSCTGDPQVDSKIFKPSCPTCVCSCFSYIYIYHLYLYLSIYAYRYIWLQVPCGRAFLRTFLHVFLIALGCHFLCNARCVSNVWRCAPKKNASGTEFSIGLEPRNPHARRGRKTFHLPLRIQVLRENDLQGRHQLRVIGHFPCESEQRRSRECTGPRVARRGAPLEPDQFL